MTLVRELDVLAAEAEGRTLAAELVKNVLSKRPEARDALHAATSGRAKEIVIGLVREALATALNEQQPLEVRTIAVQTLGAAEFTEVKDTLTVLLQ